MGLKTVHVSRQAEDSFLLEGCGICGCASLEETIDDLSSMKAVTANSLFATPTLGGIQVGESITFYVL